MRSFDVIKVGILLASVSVTLSVRGGVSSFSEGDSVLLQLEAQGVGESRPVALEALAGQVLMIALQSKYPEMLRWSVAPLARRVPAEQVVRKSVTDMKVLRIGARSAVQISWSTDDSTRQVRTVWFDVAGVQSVAVAAHDIASSAAMSVADATTEDRDVMGLNCTPLRDVSGLSQMRSRRPLRSGAAICLEAIEPRPAVSRGEDVTVHYTSARVSLTTKGIAQSDGQVGQKLRVVNPVTKDSFVAVVSAAQEVLIHE